MKGGFPSEAKLSHGRGERFGAAWGTLSRCVVYHYIYNDGGLGARGTNTLHTERRAAWLFCFPLKAPEQSLPKSQRPRRSHRMVSLLLTRGGGWRESEREHAWSQSWPGLVRVCRANFQHCCITTCLKGQYLFLLSSHLRPPLFLNF